MNSTHVRSGAVLGGVERARANQREARLRRPAHVDVDGVLQRRPRAHEPAVAVGEVDEVPVQAGVEPGREPRGHVRGEHGGGEEHRVEALVRDEPRESVDAWLRQRRPEARVVAHVHDRRAVLACLEGHVTNVRAQDGAGDLSSERGRLREHAEGALLQLSLVVLEEDQRLHSRRFSARKSTMRSAALPSSSIFCESPRAGGALSA